MLQDGDRRCAARQAFRDAAQTFHDGHPFDAEPDDISSGGMFLKTPAVNDVRTGEMLGVLLAQQAGFDPPLFLYGRIVRIRRGDSPGVGLRWERAGSTGEPDRLADSLELLFAKPASAFRASIVAVANGHLRSSYEFPRPAASAARHPTPVPIRVGLAGVQVRRVDQPPAPPRLGRPDAGPIGLVVTDHELDELDVKVVHGSQSRQGRNFKRAFDVDAGIVEPTPSISLDADPALDADPLTSSAFDAPIDALRPEGEPSRLSHANRRVPVQLQGVMSVAGIEVPIVVTGLSVTSAFAESPLAPLGNSARVGVRLDVRRRDDVTQIWLDCAVARIHEGEYGTPPGIEFKILSFDQPEQREELARILDSARAGR